jgi:hypothetical protein
MLYTEKDMVNSHVDQDLQETVDMLRRSEERAVERGMARMEVLHKRYIQAKQAGNTALAKKLRREFCQETFMNVCIAASPMELLSPDPQLEAMMGEITQELGW